MSSCSYRPHQSVPLWSLHQKRWTLYIYIPENLGNAFFISFLLKSKWYTEASTLLFDRDIIDGRSILCFFMTSVQGMPEFFSRWDGWTFHLASMLWNSHSPVRRSYIAVWARGRKGFAPTSWICQRIRHPQFQCITTLFPIKIAIYGCPLFSDKPIYHLHNGIEPPDARLDVLPEQDLLQNACHVVRWQCKHWDLSRCKIWICVELRSIWQECWNQTVKGVFTTAHAALLRGKSPTLSPHLEIFNALDC